MTKCKPIDSATPHYTLRRLHTRLWRRFKRGKASACDIEQLRQLDALLAK